MSEWLREHEDEVNKFDILMEILFQTPRESKVLPPAWKMDVEDEAGKCEHDPPTPFISVFFRPQRPEITKEEEEEAEEEEEQEEEEEEEQEDERPKRRRTTVQRL